MRGSVYDGSKRGTWIWLTALATTAGLALAPAASAAPASTCVKTVKVAPPKPAKAHYAGAYANSTCTQASPTDEGKYEKLQTPEEFAALGQQLALDRSLRSQAQIAAGEEEGLALRESGVNASLQHFLGRGCSLLRTATLESPLWEPWYAAVLAWRQECEAHSIASTRPARVTSTAGRTTGLDRTAAAAVPATTCVKATKVSRPKPAKPHYTGGFVNSTCSQPSATGEGKYEKLQTPEEFAALDGEVANESAQLLAEENALISARGARGNEELLHASIDGLIGEGSHLALTVLETAQPRPYFPELEEWQEECAAELGL